MPGASKSRRFSGANRNTTVCALLGVLNRGPQSGYDIKKFVELSISHFWKVSYGQIYPQLKSMERDGLVTAETQIQEGKPNRRIYSLTTGGHQFLREWLESDTEPSMDPGELLLKLFFGSPVSPADHRRQMEQYRDQVIRQHETYLAIDKTLQLEAAGDPDLPYWRFTLRAGILTSEAAIRWCQETLTTLTELEG